jgi:hypothetical protein
MQIMEPAETTQSSMGVRLRMLPDRTMRLMLTGELDIATCDHVVGVSLLVASSPATRVALDHGGLTFIDLHGLRAIEALIQDQADRGVVVSERATAACVRRLRRLVRSRPVGPCPEVRPAG